MLTGVAAGTTARTSCQTHGSAQPRGPRSGSLTSMTDAPPVSAACASSADRTLTSNPAISASLLAHKGTKPSVSDRSCDHFVTAHAIEPERLLEGVDVAVGDEVGDSS